VQLAAVDLQISPNPAQPGEAVTFSFRLTVIPAQAYTVVALVDGTEHIQTDGFAAVDGPVSVEMGDASDLITRYGLGMHVGAVEVRLEDRNRTTSANRTFELQEAPPPPPP
jgi:hypothetical protein